jgi:hypothetical protein
MPKPGEDAKGPDLGFTFWTGLFLAAAVGFAIAVLRVVYLDFDLGALLAIACGVAASYASFQMQELWPSYRTGPGGRPRRGGSGPPVKLAPSFEVYDPREGDEEPPTRPGGPS